MAQEMSAQVRRTVNRPATASSAAKFALYGKLGARAIYVAGDTIFYVEKGANNAVMAIDCQTGEKSVVIPGIAGVYEGARPRIKKFWKVGNRKIFTREDREEVFLWDGKGVESSLRFDGSKDMVTSCGDYVLFKGMGGYDLLNVRELRQIWHLSDEVVKYGNVLLAQNGTVWYYAVDQGNDPFNPLNNFGAVRIGLDGKSVFYYRSLVNQPYVKENNIKGKSNVTDTRETSLVRKGNYIYLPVHRRVYRLDTPNEDAQWEEFAKVPANQPGDFGRIGINNRGDMLVRRPNADSFDQRTQLYPAGRFDQPINLGDEMTSGVSSPYGYNRLYVSLCSWFTDDNDNFVLLYSDGNEIYVYNPDGVKGYKKALGRVVE